MTRWAILGTGRIAHDFTTALDHIDDAKAVACASRSKARSEEYARAHGIEHAFGSYEEMLAQKDLFDVVYIGSPHGQHHHHLMMCIEAGANVLCEKAFTLNARQAKEVVSAARAKGVFVMEAMWTRFLPCTKAIQAILENEELGEIVTVQGTFGFINPGAERLSVKALGGGALLDIGVYLLTWAGIANKDAPAELECAIGNLLSTGADEQAQIVLRFSEHSTASLFCSLRAHQPNTFDIIGTRGIVHIHKPFWTPTKYTVTKVGEEPQTFEVPHVKEVNAAHKYNFDNSEGLHHEAAHVGECLAKGLKESPVMPLDLTVQYMELMDRIRERLGVVYDCDAE